MHHRRAGLLLSLLSLALSGCGLLSAISPQAGQPGTSIALVRCGPYPSALCLQSFGLEQNQLLITFYFPAAGDTAFYLKVLTPGETTKYPCTPAEISPSTLYCTGPLIDLGTPIKIELYTATGRSPLAEGEFTLTDLALPTLAVAGEGTIPASIQTTVPTTPLPTVPGSTPATVYPNPTPP